jgi:hypothetical protein
VKTAKWNRDYHAPFGETRQNHGLGAPLRLSGEVPPSGCSLCEVFKASFRGSLFFHLSARAFRSGRCSNLRSHSSMTAETTENLTLSRAYARHDSPWPFGFALRHPLGIERLTFACRAGCSPVAGHRMQYAMCVQFLDHSLTNCVLIRCTALPPRGMRKPKNWNARNVKFILRTKYACVLINCYNKNYTTVNEYLQ